MTPEFREAVQMLAEQHCCDRDELGKAAALVLETFQEQTLNEASLVARTIDDCRVHTQRLEEEIERLRKTCSKLNDDVCQTLGKVLGYPWFKDDQKNFPGATEEDGVCVGDHVAESLAEEAAKKLKELQERK